MRVYSDITNKFYDTFDEAMAAEAAYQEEQDKKKQAALTRKEDAVKVEDAFKALSEAKKDYSDEKSKLDKEFTAKVVELKKDYQARLSELESKFSEADENYKAALREFNEAHPEGYHVTLKSDDGNSVMTIYKSNDILDNFVSRVLDSFMSSWF